MALRAVKEEEVYPNSFGGIKGGNRWEGRPAGKKVFMRELGALKRGLFVFKGTTKRRWPSRPPSMSTTGKKTSWAKSRQRNSSQRGERGSFT